MKIVDRILQRLLSKRSTTWTNETWHEFFPRRNSAGQTVTDRTALLVTAYFAAIRNISEDVAKLPADFVRRDRRNRTIDDLSDDTRWRLLNIEPNPDMSAMTFRETLMQHALGFRGGFAEIVRNGNDTAAQLWLLDPSTITIARASGRLADDFGRDSIVFLVSYGDGAQVPIPQRDMLYVRGLGYDGITSWAMSHVGQDAIGLQLAAQQFSGSYFADGIVPAGVLKVPDGMTQESIKNIRSSTEQRHRGKRKMMVLEEGMDYQQIGSDPEKSQLNETMIRGVADVARLFRMPLHKLQEMSAATFGNIEQQALEYWQDTLSPWETRCEQEYNRKLCTVAEVRNGVRWEHDTRVLLRGDLASQTEYVRQRFEMGTMSPDDVRWYWNEPVLNTEESRAYYMNQAYANVEALPKEPPSSEPDPEPVPEQLEDGQPEEDARMAPTLRVARRLLLGVLEDCQEYDAVRWRRAARDGGVEAWLPEYHGKRGEAVNDRVRPAVMESLQTYLGRDADDDEAKAVRSIAAGVASRYLDLMTADRDFGGVDLGPFVDDEAGQMMQELADVGT